MRNSIALPQRLKELYLTSPMREGVLCWYPFERDASVLDKSNGVLTELLRRRCSYVAADATKNNAQYDYAVILDPEDFSLETLKEAKCLLKPHGRLLLAYENPFALRYWNGKSSPKTGTPYDTLLGRGFGISKAKLSSRLNMAGFEGQKWYYPLSDHWFTQEVYSENHLPDELMNQRLLPYIANDLVLQFNEHELYLEIIRSGAFEFMCNAYLVEARVNADDEPCIVDYAAVTAYREPSRRFATATCSDGIVLKIPLMPEGEKGLAHIISNHNELSGLGVKVIPVKLNNMMIEMPYIKLPTIWDYWVRKYLDGIFEEDEMFSHFDRIREAIYKASKTGKCFWELVPANCFYDEQRDELTFFDQEYHWVGVSPDAAVVRAILSIKYSPVLSKDPRMKTWIDVLKKRYHLEQQWDELLMSADKKANEEIFGDGIKLLDKMTKRAVNRISKRRKVSNNEHFAAQSRYRRLMPVADKLKETGFSRPVIYGYGRLGSILHHVFDDCDIETVLIYDRKFGQNQLLETLLPEANADIIIVSIHDGDVIADDLRSRMSIPVYTLEELLDE